MIGWHAKTVILTQSVQEKADTAAKKFDRFQEAFDALQWLLARNTDIGFSKSQDNAEWHIYVQAGDPLAQTPEIWVLFIVSDNEVTLLKINVEAYKDPDE